MQLQNRRPAAGEHPLDHVVFPLINRDAAAPLLRQALQPGGQALRPVAEDDALREALCIRIRRLPIRAREIDLRHMLFRRDDTVDIVSVVRDEQQTGRVLVEPPRGHEPKAPQLRREQIEHRWLAAVGRRGEDAGGLVEHVIMTGLIAQRLAAQADDRGLRDLLLRRAGRHTVDRDLTAADIRLGLAPGSGTGIGQIFVQTDHVRPLLCGHLDSL